MVGDFETTVYEGQQSTEVWASAIVEIGSEDVKIFNSINDTWEYLISLDRNLIVYYHNLKFDGSFWMNFVLKELKLKEAAIKPKEGVMEMSWLEKYQMKSNTFKYMISSLGYWYSIIVKIGVHYIEFRDSLKILPFSVKEIGKGFETKHRKLNIKYTGYRYAGCEITDEEKQYIANDVLVVKEALEIMFSEGHKSSTIGACCMNEFKNEFIPSEYTKSFPNLYDIQIDKDLYGSETAGDYIRKSYRGGWCYLVKEKSCKIHKNGVTADVNSLYPSMMSSESGNYYPVGLPTFWKGNYIPEEAKNSSSVSPYYSVYYFIRIKTQFRIKEGYLPFIQIKHDVAYKSNECLKTSDIYFKKKGETEGKYYSKIEELDGTIRDAYVILTMTQTDYKLFQEHYDLYNTEILDGCYFKSVIGKFDEYIDKYKEMKLKNKGAKRQIAKLFLNNLYGKMATSQDSSFKYAYLKEDGSLSYYTILENKKKPGYIPIGSAITSYARNFTIRAAQANYNGPDSPGFIYADTDSIHCDLKPEELKGIKVHDKNFCCWKLESQWDIGYFVRQKAYIEHVVGENLEKIKEPYYNMKCAGMPEQSKLLFLTSMGDTVARQQLNSLLEDEGKELTEEEKEFISTKRELTDFKIGLEVPGKLLPKQIPGGTILVPINYKMRESFRA